MAFDPYMHCPGGTGKKVKFCCTDLLPELEKIERMLVGEQRLACLEHLQRVESKYPGRACLLSMKCLLLAELGETDKLATTVTDFRQQHPANPNALAEAAMLAAMQGDARASVDSLQQALDSSSEMLESRVYDALGIVADILLRQNFLLASFAHLRLQADIAGEGDSGPLTALVQLCGSHLVPLLVKEEYQLRPAPDDAPWRPEFNAALHLSAAGKWRQAAERLETLAKREPRAPAIWRNLAMLRGWLADHAGALDALRTFAALDVPLDDAVEAEALAQLLWREKLGERVNLVAIEYPILDVPEFETRIAGERCAVGMALGEWSADEPPPRAVYALLDRPALQSAVGIALDAIPTVLADLFFFGKQTDREARLRVVGLQNEQMAAAQAVIVRFAGNTIGPALPETIIDTRDALETALSWRWRLPDDAPPEQRQELLGQARLNALLERMPRLPMKLLDGKTPLEASNDPAYRIRLLALILTLEISDRRTGAVEDYNQLRQRLNLPLPVPVDAAGASALSISGPQLMRLDPGPLADETLIDAFRRASFVHSTQAALRLGLEILKRPSLDGKINKLEVYDALIRFEQDGPLALSYINDARRLAEAQGMSTATYDLHELTWHLVRQEMEEAVRLIQHLARDHANERGVSQALMSVMQQFGLIGPDGRPMLPMAPRPEAASPLILPGAGEPGKLWTPDSAQPAGEKKALWTPGM